MVEVNLWSGLRAYTDGQDKVNVNAKNVGELLQQLAHTYPGLEDVIEAGVSVAIDGKIYADGLTENVGPENEVFLLQKIKGG